MTGAASGVLGRRRSAATYTAVATGLPTRTPPSARDIAGLVLVSCALLAALAAASAHPPRPAGTTR